MSRRLLCATASAAALTLAGWSTAASAQAPAAPDARIEALQGQLARQAAQLAEQQQALAEQQAALERQRVELERLQALSEAVLGAAYGRGQPAAGPAAVPAGPPPPVQTVPPSPPKVGAPPPEEAPRVDISAVPEGYGVLTPRNHWVVEPSIDFTHGSANRLVFRGVEIVTGIQIGVIEASDADRNAVSGALAVRYGLTDRLEVEGRVPYLYRDDRVTTLAQRDETITRTFTLQGQDIGDVELAARYQINDGRRGWPIFIAGLRYKSDTGTSPFEIERDQFGVATELATGSGFWGLEGSLSFLYPTDPVVIFGGLSYLSHQPKDINKVVGEVLVRKVDPGDTIGLNAGFGFALNPRFSFSLGYKHSYIFPTKSVYGNTLQESDSLQVGAFTFGWSYALTDRISISNAYELGTTSDAPDMRIVLRFPIRF